MRNIANKVLCTGVPQTIPMENPFLSLRKGKKENQIGKNMVIKILLP